MLARKIQVNYRKALIKKGGGMCCKRCVYRQFVDIHSCAPGGEVIGKDYRCEVIGMQSSRKYSIAADHVCDRYIESKLNQPVLI